MFALLGLALAMMSPADAAPLGRSLDGQLVDISPSASPTLVVFWSMDCSSCAEEVRGMEADGLRVVSVNTDGAAQGSQLRAYVRQNGLEGPVLADADGRLQRHYNMEDGVLLLGSEGEVLARRSGPPSQAVAVALVADRGVIQAVAVAE